MHRSGSGLSTAARTGSVGASRPLGKLHTERFVPVDAEVRGIIQRILALRSLAQPEHLARSEGFLLPRGGPWAPITASMTPWPLPLHEPGAQPTLPPTVYATVMPLRCSVLASASGSHATAGAQRHRHDPALPRGHRTGSAARVSIAHARTHPTACPAFSSRTRPRRPAFPPSSRHWRRHATFWRCTVAA